MEKNKKDKPFKLNFDKKVNLSFDKKGNPFKLNFDKKDRRIKLDKDKRIRLDKDQKVKKFISDLKKIKHEYTLCTDTDFLDVMYNSFLFDIKRSVLTKYYYEFKMENKQQKHFKSFKDKKIKLKNKKIIFFLSDLRAIKHKYTLCTDKEFLDIIYKSFSFNIKRSVLRKYYYQKVIE